MFLVFMPFCLESKSLELCVILIKLPCLDVAVYILPISDSPDLFPCPQVTDKVWPAIKQLKSNKIT